ncbi:phage-related hypothetical protein [Bordetella bronchiseptica RB50]|uniref:Uncharacterized protein n=1 Tax=Bordetella bronchiseptica (strain ATCC BAA-588 / NCTC 13252 / RB50) TaxID=257310 RepID=A0A0H3LR70_BORBR|nr:phage-related hypothetical protein [Bordetella bronchiseptica]CAE34011.1 phage-related hypothetical protein [Bordetella bronchiseptica RB50]CCN17219.1 phage-related hypothetical protein [Bordetella bronchiseptica MO211]
MELVDEGPGSNREGLACTFAAVLFVQCLRLSLEDCEEGIPRLDELCFCHENSSCGESW